MNATKKSPNARPWECVEYSYDDAHLWSKACAWLDTQPEKQCYAQDFSVEFQSIVEDSVMMQRQRQFLTDHCILPIIYKEGKGCRLRPQWQAQLAVMMVGDPAAITKYMRQQVSAMQGQYIVPTNARSGDMGEPIVHGFVCIKCRANAPDLKSLKHFGQCVIGDLEKRLAL